VLSWTGLLLRSSANAVVGILAFDFADSRARQRYSA
jgi:hypothetical protein